MKKGIVIPDGELERKAIHEFSEKAYLDYSMYVILDRALPFVGDGLKPVQRRIIFGMHQLHLDAQAKYKKSARTVGDVLGKFHPHGESACYEAMVLMAQSFSYRYPLIDGQGNWGTADDPKSFAAMRYTECRLKPYARLLLEELGFGTVDWNANFDGSLEEPVRLPAQVPNVLLNGSTGIAVGMATDILPHNMTEVLEACIYLLDKPKANLDDIMQFIKGPDFCNGSEIITPKSDIRRMYETGVGSIKCRACYRIEKGDIVVDALPYQVSGAKVIEQIASQMIAKKLPMVADVRDESDHENPTRVVIIPRSNRVDTDSLMLHLFASTDLEKHYRANFNAIGLDGLPHAYPLVPLLSEWLTFRSDTIRLRLEYQLNKIQDRLHVLEGFLIAYVNIDEVIKIIRDADEPKPALIKRFKLSELQAEAILNIRLRHLAKLEAIKIKEEQEKLIQESERINQILSSDKKFKKLMKDEFEEILKNHGDKRRSPIIERETAIAMKEEHMLPSEPVTCVLSTKGWVRAAKGHDIDPSTLNYRSGDGYLSSVQGRSQMPVHFLDSTGRVYSIAAHLLPSARSLGDPLTGKFSPPSDSAFVGLIMGEANEHVLLASNSGYGFITTMKELYVKNKKGKRLLNVSEGMSALALQTIHDLKTALVVCITKSGKLLCFKAQELPIMTKGKGNKMIQIASAKLKSGEDSMMGFLVVHDKETVEIFAGKRKLNLSNKDLKTYLGQRAKSGLKLPRGYQKISDIQIKVSS